MEEDYPDYYEDYPGPIPIKLDDPDSLGQCSSIGLGRIVNISISVNPIREYTDYYEYYSVRGTTIQATAGNLSESYRCARSDLEDNRRTNGGFYGCNDCPMSGLEQQCQVVRKFIFIQSLLLHSRSSVRSSIQKIHAKRAFCKTIKALIFWGRAFGINMS